MTTVEHDPRLLIDGQLIRRRTPARRSTTSTRRPRGLGPVADRARPRCTAPSTPPRAFDETDCRRNARSPRCARAAAGGARGEREAFREELILEVGCPRITTNGPQLDAPLADAISYPTKLIESSRGRSTARRSRPDRRGEQPRDLKEPAGVVGAIVRGTSRSRSRSQGRAGARTGNTMVLKRRRTRLQTRPASAGSSRRRDAHSRPSVGHVVRAAMSGLLPSPPPMSRPRRVAL